MVDPTTAIPVLLAGLGGVVWAIRLEGRVDKHEATDAVIHADIKQSLERVEEGQTRLESKVDRLTDKLIPQAHNRQ